MTKTQMKRYMKDRGMSESLYKNFEFKYATDVDDAFDVVDDKLRKMIDAKSRGPYATTWEQIEHNIDVYEEIEKMLYGFVR